MLAASDVFCYRGCFPGSSVVLTPCGEKSLAQLKIGDKVMDATGRFVDVLNFWDWLPMLVS